MRNSYFESCETIPVTVVALVFVVVAAVVVVVVAAIVVVIVQFSAPLSFPSLPHCNVDMPSPPFCS